MTRKELWFEMRVWGWLVRFAFTRVIFPAFAAILAIMVVVGYLAKWISQ